MKKSVHVQYRRNHLRRFNLWLAEAADAELVDAEGWLDVPLGLRNRSSPHVC